MVRLKFIIILLKHPTLQIIVIGVGTGLTPKYRVTVPR